MTVTGGRAVAAALRAVPDRMREPIAEAVAKAAASLLLEMQRLTPRDAANPGRHAADGLTVQIVDGGLKAYVGLPSDALAQDYFWFRFLDGGTKGGVVQYKRAGKLGKRYKMKVPRRRALHIRDRAVDATIDETRNVISEAVRRAISGV